MFVVPEVFGVGWESIDTLTPSQINSTFSIVDTATFSMKHGTNMRLSVRVSCLCRLALKLWACGLSPESRHFFKDLAPHPGHTAGKGKYLGKHIELAIQRGKPASLLCIMPRSGGLDEIFYL